MLRKYRHDALSSTVAYLLKVAYRHDALTLTDTVAYILLRRPNNYFLVYKR